MHKLRPSQVKALLAISEMHGVSMKRMNGTHTVSVYKNSVITHRGCTFYPFVCQGSGRSIRKAWVNAFKQFLEVAKDGD